MHQEKLDYLSELQNSRQWGFFLRAQAQVFKENLSNEELRFLMGRIGAESAKNMNLSGITTLLELEQALAVFWKSKDWGFVNLIESDNFIQIDHYCSPIEQSFGPASLEWSAGFMEGFYSQLFKNLKAGPELIVTQISSDDSACLSYRLST